jgi:hypothetical protein
LTPGTVTLKTPDTASTSYGTKDGTTLCGARTYTVTYVHNALPYIPATSFISKSSNVLTVTPTLVLHQGDFIATVTACLDNFPLISC